MKKLQKITTKWDLSPLLKESLTEELFKKKLKFYKRKNEAFIKKWKDNKEYLKSPKVLKEALDDYAALLENHYASGSLFYYVYLRYNLNQTDAKTKGFLNRLDEFDTSLENQMTFFILNLSKVPVKKQKEFLKSPLLKDYKHYLEKLFRNAKHLLSEKEENLLNMYFPVSYGNWSKLTEELISKEVREVFVTPKKKEKKTFEDIFSLISDKNEKVRDYSAKVFNDILSTWVDVAEREYNSIMQYFKIRDALRGYKRPDEERHLSTDVDSEVVDSLLDSVTRRFNLSKRYYKLKARLMGVKKLEYHERTVPYGSLDKQIPYKKAVNLVYTVFDNLDKEFGRIFNYFASTGKIDVLPKKGKSSGAFCIHNLRKHPVYILLNYTNKITDVIHLAHEAGHGINSELMKKHQNPLNFRSPLSTAEVASKFMEDFVLDYLEKEMSEEERLSLLMRRLDDSVSAIFRQVAAYNFEYDVHTSFRKSGYLSKEQIGSIFKKHMSAYMGPFVKQSKGSENWWVYWGHFRYPFYVYTYASGLLISKYLQGRVKQDPSFVKQVKTFLSAGSSDSPKNLFKNLGIDITDKSFWEEGLKEIESLLNETEALAKKLGKI